MWLICANKAFTLERDLGLKDLCRSALATLRSMVPHVIKGPPPLRLRSPGRQLILPCGRGLGCLHPHAVHNPRDQAPYWLFYTPYPPDEAELPYLARSTDGVRFHCRGVHNPLLERGEYGSWDSRHLADVDIIRVGGTWYMYYAGASWVRGTKRVAIGLALSDDGMVWRKVSRPVLEPSRDHWWRLA